MQIIREISSSNPEKCRMVAKGFFGFITGEVKYSKGYSRYNVIVNGEQTGSATDFIAAGQMLLEDLKVIKTICV